MELRKLMKEKHGYSQSEVISNLDYLVQKGWLTRIEERRTFTTPKGTVQPEPKITYKISDIGIDRLEAHRHTNVATSRSGSISQCARCNGCGPRQRRKHKLHRLVARIDRTPPSGV